MLLTDRLKASSKVAAIHLLLSAGVALVAAYVVLGVWYPHPYDVLAGGRGLFLLLVGVSLGCGPLLTLLLFNPTKSRMKWRMDVALIASLQIGALAYGISQAAAARPVFLAFEGNRFRIVQAMDIEPSQLMDARPEFGTLGYGGPQMIGVRLSQSTDVDFPASVNLSLQGLHPSFRPVRWLPLEEQASSLRAELKPLDSLLLNHTARQAELNAVLRLHGDLDKSKKLMGFLPLVNEDITDWIVVIDKRSLKPVAYLHMDGW